MSAGLVRDFSSSETNHYFAGCPNIIKMKIVLNIIAVLCCGVVIISMVSCGNGRHRKSGNSDGYIELKRQLEEIVGDGRGSSESR